MKVNPKIFLYLFHFERKGMYVGMYKVLKFQAKFTPEKN
jgi:hypothetical protein